MSRKLVLLTALIIVLVGTLGVAFKVQRVTASGTIYIRADGTIEGTNIIERDGDVYTFKGNINGSIVVQRSGIFIDGALHILQGPGSGSGFSLTGINYVTIKHTLIRNFTYGVFLDWSGDNYVIENTIQNNSVGVYLYGTLSTYNYVIRNSIVDNGVGVEVMWDSCNNTFFHNVFVDNGIHARVWGEESNLWSKCEPIVPWNEGNYWNNYTGVDSNYDGIGDTPYFINDYNEDPRPLMGRIIGFCGQVDTLECCFWVISNSWLGGFWCGSIGFNVTGEDGTDGFCRVTIPHDVLEPPYSVTVNNNPVTHTTLFENETLSIIYFTYMHSTKEVVIVPEFPSFLIPPLFMIATLAAVIIYKIKHMK